LSYHTQKQHQNFNKKNILKKNLLSYMRTLSGINIAVNKTTFSPNEAIEGTITLKLEKPMKSKGVFVALTSGETKHGHNSKGQSTTTHYTHVGSSIPLDVEKEYPAGQVLTYPFRLVAPSRTAPFDLLGNVWKSFRKDSTPPSKNYNVEAKLDISMGFDVRARVVNNEGVTFTLHTVEYLSVLIPSEWHS
jgi:hypothetical protein